MMITASLDTTTGAPVAVSLEIDGAAWDKYVEGHPRASGYHRWCWRGVFERAFGHETLYFSARRGGEMVGVLPLVAFRSLLFGRFLVSLPFVNYGGVLADDGEAASALLSAARDAAETRKARYVELRHTVRMFAGLPARQHKVAMTLPLRADAEAAWKSFDNKVRNQVRKAQKAGLTTEIGGARLVADFYRVFSRNMRDLGTPVYSRRFFTEVVGAVPDARVHVVRRGDLPIAAGITLGHRAATENPWASSLREHRSLNANMLLYWAMIEDAVRRGYSVFDFGRSTPGEWTYHFKRQWGANATPLHWEYVLLTNGPLPDNSPKNERFKAAIAVWRRLPVFATRLLGPSIVKSIP